MLEFAEGAALALFVASCVWLGVVTGGLPRKRTDPTTGQSSLSWQLRPSEVRMGRVSAAVASLAVSGATAFALSTAGAVPLTSFLVRWIAAAAVLTALGFLSAAMGIGRATGTG